MAIKTNYDLIVRNETNANSKGGTELLQERLYDGSVPRELLENTQIVFSRIRDLDSSKPKIYYAHDLAEDPESQRLRDESLRNRFDAFVFASNWQMEQFAEKVGIPYSKSYVIKNSIVPFDIRKAPEESETIRFIYHTTPHRGLEILVPVFNALAQVYPNIHLDVYSSFKIYGWEERDAAYVQLFDYIKQHPNMTYHGSVSNEEVREALTKSDVFAYPSIWRETSCLALIEAMSAGLLCVHPNLAALYETSMGLTWMYQWNEAPHDHANTLYSILTQAIEVITNQRSQLLNDLNIQQIQTNRVHNWSYRAKEWTALLETLQAK